MTKKLNNILIVATHPDDEILGCGGTIAKHVDQGDNVIACIICEGETHRGISQNDGNYTKKAAEILGISEVIHSKLPDQMLDTIPIVNVIAKIEDAVNTFKPAIIYTHHNNDINKDHQIVFESVLVAARPTLSFIKSIYSFDTSSSTEWSYPRTFIPDTWVDISQYLGKKLEAMECYISEIKDYPHPRSLKALENKAISLGNQCLMNAAEGFMTVRKCIRPEDLQS